MEKVVVGLISRLGRYAAILPLLAITLIVFGWLSLFDDHPFIALGAAFAVVPLAMGGAALAIGMLVAPSARLPKDGLSREDAPRLWALWDEVDPKRARRRVLVVDHRVNASMGERRGPLGLVRTEILSVGLPLLMICDEPAVKAIVAHEAGHARLAHASGLANIHDFVGAFDMLFMHADPGDTIFGGLADLAFSGGMRRLTRRMRAVSRRHEFEADAFAGDLKPDMARALVLLQAANHSLDELVYRPLERELLGAVSPPPSPIARISELLAEIHRRGGASTARLPAPSPSAEAAADEALYGSTHPGFEARLKALGFEAAPEIAPVATPASETMLPQGTLATLTKTFEERWRRRAGRITGGDD